MNRIIVLIFCCFIFIPLCVSAKDIKDWTNEMLSIQADTEMNDSLKIIDMSKRSLEYFIYYGVLSGKVDEYMDMLSPLAEKHQSNNLWIYVYSTAIFLTGDDDERSRLTDKCIDYIDKSNDPETRFYGWMLIGRRNVYDDIGLNYFFNARNEIKDKELWTLESDVYRYIAYYYRIHGNSREEQLKYAKMSVGPAQKSGNARHMVYAWSELGAAYFESEITNCVDSAMIAYNQARDLYLANIKPGESRDKFIDDAVYLQLVLTLGTLHFQKKEMSLAIEFINETLDIANENDLADTQAFCLKELGIIYQELKEYDKALTYYLQAESIVLNNPERTLETNHIDYEVKLQLAGLYKETGKVKLSAEYYQSGIDQYRRMFDEERMIENKETSAYYESKKKEEDIRSLTTIVSLKEKQKYYYLGIIFILIIACFIIFKLYGYKIKMSKQNELRLKDEANMLALARSKAELKTQIKNREAEQLQEKIQLGSDLIDHKNIALAQLKTFFSAHPELKEHKTTIESIFNQQNRVENNVNDITNDLQDVPLDFYQILQDHADNKLTSLDLKYCRLLYLDTPSKEIAGILYVEPETVRVNKYRLKQKLKLPKEEDLHSFIKNTVTQKQSDL